MYNMSPTVPFKPGSLDIKGRSINYTISPSNRVVFSLDDIKDMGRLDKINIRNMLKKIMWRLVTFLQDGILPEQKFILNRSS